MFDFVRKHTKIMMFLMFLLIIPAFVLVGVDGYRRMSGGGPTVAKIGSHSITQEEWDAGHKVEVDKIRARNPNMDAKLLDSAQARYMTLETMVRELVMADALQDAHLVTTDARLARELQRDPTIASLRKADGALDVERYKQYAASRGFTPEGFEARVRADISLQQLESGVGGAAMAPAVQTAVAMNALFERREVQVASFMASDYASKVVPADAEIEAYYQANPALFQAPETASVEYLVLDLDSVKSSIKLNEQDLKTYYEQNVARLSGKEERRASHILINASKMMPAAEREKAKARAQALLAQVKKSPESFAEVAKKNSQDAGSAANGGDLDFFGRGAMVKPFEEAVFAMKKGEISDVVESDFGFHIIKLTDLKSPKQKSFEELRASIEADLKTQQAQRKYSEVAVEFSNGVYEQSDSLKAVADKLKLEIRTAAKIGRLPSPDAKGALANPKFLNALFSPDSVEKKRNTEALELAPNLMVSGRITQYAAAHTLPLADVRSDVRAKLVLQRAAELAKKDGAEKLEAWKRDASAASLQAAVVISRQQGEKLLAAVREAAMKADPVQLPAWAGVDLGPQGYAVVRVNKVLERSPVEEAVAKQERTQFTQWIASAEQAAYYQSLKERYKVQIKVPPPTSSTGFGAATAE
jgi:peptidyl-prolyl cis-trans isomerase D